MKRVFVCNDNITGIFSAIYDAWKTMLSVQCSSVCRNMEFGIALKGMVELELFCEYVEVEENTRCVMQALMISSIN